MCKRDGVGNTADVSIITQNIHIVSRNNNFSQFPLYHSGHKDVPSSLAEVRRQVGKKIGEILNLDKMGKHMVRVRENGCQ